MNKYNFRTIQQRRVVVTGIGAITPLGLNVSESWEKAIHGKSGVAKISLFDCENFESKIAAEVKGFELDKFVDKKDQKKMDRFIHLSLASTDEALKDSGIEFNEELNQRTGTIIGVGMGGLPIIESQHSVLLEKGPRRISPFFIPAVLTNLASGQISIRYGFGGVNYTVTSACSSGSHSIGEAANYIRNNLCDVVIAGGAEACVSVMGVGGFSAMKALSTRNDEPEKASRPWDKDRDGFVIAEGAATLVLEEYERAVKRGAKIYCELTGYGVSSDAYHMTSPSVGGVGAARAITQAIQDAQIQPEDIGYINAHGTSTPAGDLIETEAIKRAFSDSVKDLCVSSTKSMTGHTLGAAGAIESVFSIMALKNGIIPPTINLENPSEGCDLDYVPNQAREKKLKHVLNNSFGFGGTNSCLIFSSLS
ncbi:MAG: beta-ketoacyl-ACP synthase II [Bdellovibrionaceae bacterium]|nr:beta-ketoacyl-ACP synthase II [Pseudobdellovibrionaceae bacterium]